MPAVGCLLELFDLFAPNVVLSHEALHSFVVHMKTSSSELIRDPQNAVGVPGIFHYILNLGYQHNVRFVEVFIVSPCVIALKTNTKGSAHGADSEDVTMFVNPGVPYSWC